MLSVGHGAEPQTKLMATQQDQFDDAMFDFSQADYDSAIAKLQAVLDQDPAHFDAQLALGMALYRKGDYQAAIAAGHRAEQLKPKEQLVHTNLSLFYMKAGDKKTAEHHGLQARIASWRDDKSPPGSAPTGEPELSMAKPPTPPATPAPPKEFPDMPWKKKPQTH
jgi:tetratricopeptide (TPR) repeat protein